MKLLVELNNKDISKYKNIDGIILGLRNFSIFNQVDYTLEEIESLSKKYPNLDIFIKIDKNIFNSEIEELKKILIFLNKLNIKGIFFYDLALLQIKKELDLNINLIWAQTHMVTNYKTCNYYYDKGVKYALLSKEITLDEILEINNKSKIKTIVEVFSLPTVGFSRRKLITNYNHDIGNNNESKHLEVLEKVSNDNYIVKEEEAGTGFILDKILNGTSIIKDLYENKVDYILLKEVDKINFKELISDTKEYIDGKCLDNKYIDKYKDLGSTGFFFKKTIYRVKK